MPVSIYIAYAIEDTEAAAIFLKYFRRMERAKEVNIMHLHKLAIGINETETAARKRHIAQAQAIILLNTPSFLNSDIWFEIEPSVKAARERGAKLIPIIFKACDWEREIFAEAIVLPRNKRAILSQELRLQEEAYTAVFKEIRTVIKTLNKPMPAPSFETTELIKILFLAANPSNTGRLRLDQEVRDIREGLKRSNYRHKFELTAHFAVQSKDLNRALLETTPQIIHFSGHGLQGAQSGGIVLEDNNGEPKVVSAEALAKMFSLFAATTNCVLLNSCYSQDQATAIAQHIPYVIGMNQAIADTTAISFVTGFYDALGAGQEIPFAFEFAKASIMTEGLKGEEIPVLFKK